MPRIPDEYRDKDVHLDIITTSKHRFVITWVPSKPNVNAGQILAKMSDLIKAHDYVKLQDYAIPLGVEIITQARYDVNEKAPNPPAGDPSAFLRDFQMTLLRHNDTLEARDIWENFKKSRPKDFDPVTLEPTTPEGKQIRSNVETVLTGYRAGGNKG